MSTFQLNNTALRTNKSQSNFYIKKHRQSNPLIYPKTSHKSTRALDRKNNIDNPLQHRANTFESEYQIKFAKEMTSPKFQRRIIFKSLNPDHNNRSVENQEQLTIEQPQQENLYKGKSFHLNSNNQRINNYLKEISNTSQMQDFNSSQPKQYQLQQSQPASKYQECKLKNMQMESTVNNFISINEQYYRHIQGLCYCAICTCGKHLCDFAKSYHLQSPFKQTPAQSIYTIDYDPKKTFKGPKFNPGIYDGCYPNPEHLDILSINRADYTKPAQDSYGNSLSFKPTYVLDNDPQTVGRSQYKRDYLEWGTSYVPVKGSHQKTTVEGLPFSGITSYNRSFRGLQGPKAEPAGNNYTLTCKNGIPFQGLSTSQQFFQGIKPSDKAVVYKQKGELFTGVPSFQGQFKTLFKNDYIQYKKNCPVIDLKLQRQNEQNA